MHSRELVKLDTQAVLFVFNNQASLYGNGERFIPTCANAQILPEPSLIVHK